MTTEWQPPPNVISAGQDQNIIWSMCEEMGKGERHFNELQANYRKMAASWVIALFIALSFLFFPSNDTHARMISDEAAMVFTLVLALIAIAGIAALWILDLLVYHRLLLAYFFAGKKLEEQHLWLPRVRHNMRQLNSTWPVLKKIVLFYAVCLAVCVAIVGGATREMLSSEPELGLDFGISALLSFTISTILLYSMMSLVTKTDVKIENQMK